MWKPSAAYEWNQVSMWSAICSGVSVGATNGVRLDHTRTWAGSRPAAPARAFTSA